MLLTLSLGFSVGLKLLEQVINNDGFIIVNRQAVVGLIKPDQGFLRGGQEVV